MNQERRDKIAEMLERQHTIKNTELMERFGISIETVRRDLAYLEEQGFLERVYGGAVRKRFMNAEPGYTNREKENSSEKLMIAHEAEKLIHQNDTVFFDLGTTVLSLARNIDSGKDITAFTNSLRTAIVLSEKGCDVIIPGGQLRAGEFAVSGSLAESGMQQFNIDKAIIGVAGITESGITDFVLKEASLRRQVIKNARKVIALADFSKFGVRAMCNVCPLADIDVLITDEKAPSDMLKEFEKKGIKIIVANL
ncbi:MAG: DeoR/GlpR transcriptional regulator [Clostridia bacterium]|nr:DeoR/GlpR transcriptional regulator [Clostridia bacterium]